MKKGRDFKLENFDMRQSPITRCVDWILLEATAILQGTAT